MSSRATVLERDRLGRGDGHGTGRLGARDQCVFLVLVTVEVAEEPRRNFSANGDSKPPPLELSMVLN